MGFNRELPYTSLPLLPPKTDIETKTILKKAISANRALANLKGSGRNIPNQSVLIHCISLQEAKLSSEIENIVTTNDELFQAASSDKKIKDPNTKEVIHYQEALWQGFKHIKKTSVMNTNLFIKLVNIIKENTAGIRNCTGIKVATLSGKTIYTPPDGEKIIRDKLENLEKYINENNDDIDPLIKMAVIHYQFEAIHPFFDGNGRVGRIINVLYLIHAQLLNIPVLYLSKYIIENKSRYYKGIINVTEKQQWESWILYMLDAIEQTAIYTQEKIDSIYDLMQRTKRIMKEKLPKIYSKELLELLFHLPYCKIKFIENEKIAKRQTASSYLTQLSDIGILEAVKVGKEMLYLNKEFYSLLKS
ncbi:Fic family protein [bacterium]|nr:Fic family protein [bacterium]